MDKNTDVGAINSKAQLDGANHPQKYRRGGDGRGRECTRWKGTDARCRPRAYWCRPCFFTGVQPSHTIAREEIFGPVLSGDDLPHAGGGDRAARTTLRCGPYGLAAGVWTDKGSKIFKWRASCGGRGLAEHLQQVRSREPVRRVQGERLRPRGRVQGLAGPTA
jgi:aldehyde dehydrogenase (NAD+)